MLYLKIKQEKIEIKPKSIFEKIITFLLPSANPDFENKMNEVHFWLLEFIDDKSSVNREIGLNKHNEVIMKLPNNENYGFWSDNQMVFNDYKNIFKTQLIDKNIFEKKWSNNEGGNGNGTD